MTLHFELDLFSVAIVLAAVYLADEVSQFLSLATS